MFSTYLKEISGYFNRRFLLSAFFPVLAFASLNLAMSLALWGPQLLVDLWQQQATELKALASIGAIILIFFIAYLFHVFKAVLSRIYEGNWNEVPIIKWWEKNRRKHYQLVWDYIDEESKQLNSEITALEKRPSEGEETSQELENRTSEGEETLQELERLRKAKELRNHKQKIDYKRFRFLPPSRSDVMPTMLGNILRNSESYSMQHYNIDAIVIWPRLQSLLPKDFLEELRDAEANVDLLLLVTTLAGLSAFGWEIYLGFFSDRYDLFLISTLGWILALVGYFSALQAALTFSELFKAAFDLYRWDLLKALHLKLPENYKVERKLWEVISQFFYRNYPPSQEVLRFETEIGKSPTPSTKPGIFNRIFSLLIHPFTSDDR